MKQVVFKTYFILLSSYFVFLSSCSVTKQISKQANTILINDTAVSTGHIGISIYEPATNTYWYNYNASHYFIPASNTKLFTLYAGMKYLGDSLVGLRYDTGSIVNSIIPTGDPTFLHPDFSKQPVYDFLKRNLTHVMWFKGFINKIWRTEALGNGWAWNDYSDDYMVERSPMPIYGNVATFRLLEDSFYINPFQGVNNMLVFPVQYKNKIYQDGYAVPIKKFYLQREAQQNRFNLVEAKSNFTRQTIPFVTNGIYTTAYFLNSLLYDFEYDKKIAEDSVNRANAKKEHMDYRSILKPKQNPDSVRNNVTLYDMFPGYEKMPDIKKYKILHSQPSDSLFKPMMHRSDNFFAEQTLLMVSNEKLGYMSDADMIEYILKNDLKGLPQRPKWVDGSGLSRYNLFTPMSLVYLLDKMKKEFSWNRLTTILATGGEGTISNYYKKDSGFIYAKTGTLSNNCALSGYLITNKGKVLIFSVLANNYITGATPVRRAVERFLEGIRAKY